MKGTSGLAIYLLIVGSIASAIFRIGRAVPRAIPALSRRIVPLMQPSVVTDHAYRVYASRRNIPFTEMEYGFPREHAAEVIPRVLEVASDPDLRSVRSIERSFSLPLRAIRRPSISRSSP